MSRPDPLRSAPLPRSPSLVRRFALQAEGTVGFILYGVLWAIVGVVVAAGVAAVLLGVVGGVQVGLPLSLAPLVGFVGVIGLAVWLFRRFVGARLGPWVPLFRDGRFVDGTLVEVRQQSGRMAGHAVFSVLATVDGKAFRADVGAYVGRDDAAVLREGSTVAVLCAAGPVDGTACAVFCEPLSMVTGILRAA